MAQNLLKELLQEDQEPFQLKDYITDKQIQLKKQAKNPHVNLRKPKHISKNTSFLCKNACFLSLQDSPDLRKSPLFDFSTKSPCKSPNKVFLNVPAKTAALLLDAAMRIQKQKNNPKAKREVRTSGFKLFGSVLKKLSLKNKAQKIKCHEAETKTEDQNRGAEDTLLSENATFSATYSSTYNASSSSSSSSSACSYNGRLSSLDLESSCSGRSLNGDDEDEGFEFANVLVKDTNSNNGDYGFCLSPLSPFRFSLQTSPCRSPGFAKSPACRKLQDNVNDKQVFGVQFQSEEEEEDKEQHSPVSVLDPPFEDDDYDGQEDYSYDQECSYAFGQRAKQHLLHKLHSFEKLAELDFIELEKRLIEEEDELEKTNNFQELDSECFSSDEQSQLDELVDIIKKSGFQDIKKPGIKRLTSDLIVEEENEKSSLDNEELLIKRVCKRLELWNDVESNTIDMMVDTDLRRENYGGWKKPQEQFSEVARDIEVCIFGGLVDELVEDLS